MPDENILDPLCVNGHNAMKSDTNPLWQSHNNTRQSPPETLDAQRQR